MDPARRVWKSFGKGVDVTLGDTEPEFRFGFLFDGKFGRHYYKTCQSYHGTTVRHVFSRSHSLHLKAEKLRIF